MAIEPVSEYYIRRPDSDEVRGPFNVDKLATLAEAGQIDRDMLYYDEDKLDWVPFAANEPLRAEVFSEKRRINLRARTHAIGITADVLEKSLTIEDLTRREVRVDKILAAAEGDTGEQWSPLKRRQLTEAVLGNTPIMLGTLMALSGVLLAWHDLDNLTHAFANRDFSLLVREPLVIVGAADIVVATLLFLRVSEVFPYLRFRAMFGLGLFGYLAWNAGDPSWFIANVLAAASIFTITIASEIRTTLGAFGLGLVAFVWMFAQKFFS